MSIERRSHQYGTVFEHWQIKEPLGHGSAGRSMVFRLYREDSPWETSALKVISLIEEQGNFKTMSAERQLEYQAAVRECKENAAQEVRLMADLRGKTNIVDYLDHKFVNWSDSGGYGCDMLIRMELLEDLRDLIRQGQTFREEEVIKIGRDICQALMLCHRKNILHRDIKPENIFRSRDGDYKLGDFGISRILDTTPMSMASTGIGTPEYAAPEQGSGHYDTRVDIYSLGLVLYELANGNKLPFASSGYIRPEEVQKRQMGVPLPKPSGASRELAEVILKACAYRPEDRYQNAREFARALDSIRVPGQEQTYYNGAMTGKNSYQTVAADRKDGKTEYNTGNDTKFGGYTIPAEEKQGVARQDHWDHDERQRRRNNFLIVSITVLAVAIFCLIGSMIWMFNSLDPSDDTAGAESQNTAVHQVENSDAVLDTVPAEVETETVVPETEVPATEVPAVKVPETGIIEISAGGWGSYALTAEGTMLVTGGNQYGQCDVRNWRDIISISGGDCFVVGLKADGTLEAAGRNDHGQCDISDWRNIVAVSAGTYHTVGLRSDGTVVAAGGNENDQCDVSGWTDIIAISAGENHTVALRADGTVTAVGNNDYGQCNVAGWTDVIAISAGVEHTVGLKSDGTVLMVGSNWQGQCNGNGWTDIIAISAGDYYSVGLRSDGTCVAVGSNEYGQCDVEHWDGIRQISARFGHTLGLTEDGKVVAVGWNNFQQCDVSGWA